MGGSKYKLNALYSDCIIGLRSCLDLLTKLFYVIYELNNYTGNYSSRLKFRYNSKYYSDAKEISKLYGLTNTVFELDDKYEGLSLVRNELVHNSFINSIPHIYHGNGTPQVNQKDIDYMISFMWDLDNTKPVNFLNRKRFFSQQNQMDKYLIEQYLTLVKDVDISLNSLISWLLSVNK